MQKQLKDSFGNIYLTALSVIQGVALADLVSVVSAEYKQFTVTHWLLVVLTFGLLIAVWNLYTTHSTLWQWIPDLRDAFIPFVFGAIELFLNHMIVFSLSAWLFATAALGIMGGLAIVYARHRAGEETENEGLRDWLHSNHVRLHATLLEPVVLYFS